MEYYLTIVYMAIFSIASAQEFRGGEMWFERIDDINYDVYVDVYMKGQGTNEKPFLLIDCGFCGSSPDTASLIFSELLPQGIKLLRYNTHLALLDENTEYIITVIDSFHLPGLLNLDGPNKGFYFLQSYVTTTWYQIFGNNSPPVFINKQTDYGFNNGVFEFSSSAQDPDGDTLFYGLKDYNNVPGLEYSYPAATDSFSCGFHDGSIIWDKPTEPGKYLFGIEVYEYHPNGFYLGRGGRDMVVEITEGDILATTGYLSLGNLVMDVFPNPAKKQINLNFHLPNDPQYVAILKAYNSLGQLICQKNIFASMGNFQDTVDVSNWVPGVYFFMVTVGGHVRSEKVVVQ